VGKIDEYLKTVEPAKRRELERIRALAHEIVPGAEETIAYRMPTLKYDGTPFLGFDARARHIGIYPYSGSVIEELRETLRAFGLSKGAIRVPLNRPISKAMLRKVILWRLGAIRSKDLGGTMAGRKKSPGRKKAAPRKKTGARKTAVKKTAPAKKSARKYGAKSSQDVEEAMREMKQGTLRSGRSGKNVTSRKQAVAIGLAEARREGGKVPKKK
jgi:uncharacterized protein YdhG (YjbR/CyaY superfamily)